MKATVSEKGQVTIPKALRERLGLEPGQVLDFEEDQGRLVARKVFAEDPIDAVFGILGGEGPTTDEFITEIRGASDAVEGRG